MAQCVDDEDDAWSDCEAADAEALVPSITDVNRSFPSAADALAFDVSNGFDLAKIATARKVDFYGAVKLVNFARAAVARAAPFDAAAAAALTSALTEGDEWRGDAFLKPALDPDELLHRLEDCLDLVSDDDGDDDAPAVAALRSALVEIAAKTDAAAAALRDSAAYDGALSGPKAPLVDSAAPLEARLEAELDVARGRLAHLEELLLPGKAAAATL